MGYSPWVDAGERFADVHIEKANIAPVWGAWVPTERVILLGRHLSIAQTRHALAHEIAHIDLGHRQCVGIGRDGDRLAHRNETAAERLAALRLIDIDELADSMRAMECCCETLRVTPSLVRTRLATMGDPERNYLMNRTEHLRETA